MAMPLEKRIAAVAKDVKTKADRFAGIPAHDLAEALEVPQPEQPSNDWFFWAYAHKGTLEEYAHSRHPVSEFVYCLEGKVPEERFRVLREKFEGLDRLARPKFGFLTTAERKIIERTLDHEELERNMSNGISTVARYCVKQGRIKLRFEGDIEDDGDCITLRTPYDERKGNFVDLSNCITNDW